MKSCTALIVVMTIKNLKKDKLIAVSRLLRMLGACLHLTDVNDVNKAMII